MMITKYETKWFKKVQAGEEQTLVDVEMNSLVSFR